MEHQQQEGKHQQKIQFSSQRKTGNFSLVHVLKPRRETTGKAALLLNLFKIEKNGQLHAPAALTPGKEIHWIG